MNKTNPLLAGSYRIKPAGPLRGTIRVPGDKSISHRAVMLASLAEGTSSIRGFLESEDCVATLRAFEKMGVVSQRNQDAILIHGQGLPGLQEPDDILDMGNSGTGSRLLLGILAGQPFSSTLTGDVSLRSRPMGRVTKPLSQMGASFIGREKHTKLPLSVYGGELHGIDYTLPVASAQIKSALLLAGIFAQGTTHLHEPGPSRDHTERMLKTFGVQLESAAGSCSIVGGQTLQAQDILIPGDFSSAAFFMIAATLVPGSEMVIENVGMNPTRLGLLEVLQAMNADVTIEKATSYGSEPAANLRIRHSRLKGARIHGDTVVRMIDEFPIFAAAAALASTPSVVEEANELRVKESDRISAIVQELNLMGVEIQEREDGFTVAGNAQLRGAAVCSQGDHRIAMTLAVLGLIAAGETVIQGTAPVATSFPGFFDLLESCAPGSVEQIS